MIFISGGGDEDKTVAMDFRFAQGLRGRDILFIPIAKTRDMNGYKKSLHWLITKLNKLSSSSLNISMVLDLGECRLDNISAIYIGGGNTYKLLHLMNVSGFLPVLKRYVNDGGTVYGASAGAVLMGQDISTYIEEKYLRENQINNYTSTNGLGLVGNYSIITHFHNEDSETVKKYIKNKGYPVIAIPEGAGLIVENGGMCVIGDKIITVFEKNGITTEIAAGIVFPIY